MQTECTLFEDGKTLLVVFWVKFYCNTPKCKAVLTYEKNKISSFTIEEPKAENEDSKVQFTVNLSKAQNNITFKGYLHFRNEDD